MGLKSIFQRKSGKTAPAARAEAPADLVQEARTRARRRLIGAVVLVVIGVIGFPLLFETQPRPIPVDIPIEIPRKDAVPPLVMPTARPAKPVAVAPVEPPASAAPAEPLGTETQADAGREVPPPAARPPSAPTVAKAGEPAAKPAAAAIKPSPAPASTTEAAANVADARRAQALLEGKAADKEAARKDGRYVVQVGAFADTAAARETRQKVEKLGLKTYTQVAETAQGSRIRVRVGPFASRDEADRAQAKIKAAGTQAVVLTL